MRAKPFGYKPALVRTTTSLCNVLWTGQRSAISSMRFRCSSVKSPFIETLRTISSIFPSVVSQSMQSFAWILP